MVEALEIKLAKVRWDWEHAACCGNTAKMEALWQEVKLIESQIISAKAGIAA